MRPPLDCRIVDPHVINHSGPEGTDCHLRSTAVVQRLLEHSSPDLTNKVYTNVDPVLHHAVDQIPAGDWLKR
jgi:integrase